MAKFRYLGEIGPVHGGGQAVIVRVPLPNGGVYEIHPSKGSDCHLIGEVMDHDVIDDHVIRRLRVDPRFEEVNEHGHPVHHDSTKGFSIDRQPSTPPVAEVKQEMAVSHRPGDANQRSESRRTKARSSRHKEADL